MGSERYGTAEEVFAAFPHLATALPRPAEGTTPAAYARALAANPRSLDGILFSAFWLRRREAVFWAARAARHLARPASAEDARLCALAEAWVEAPGEDTRRAALSAGLSAPKTLAGTFLALAAGWSGGTVLAEEDGPRVPPAPELTGQAAATAVMIAVSAGDPRRRAERVRTAVEAAIGLSAGGTLAFHP